MPRFEHGLQKGAETAVYGFFIGLIVRLVLQAFEMEELLLFFILINGLLIIILFNNMKYWGIGYTIGWIVGIIFFIMFVPWWEVVIYFIYFIIPISIKIMNKFERLYL